MNHKYKKYFRKTSLKQKGHGEFFLNEILKKKPKFFLEIGVFHGVTARNICELLYQIHKKNQHFQDAEKELKIILEIDPLNEDAKKKLSELPTTH